MLNNRKLAEAIDTQTEAIYESVKASKAMLEWFKSHLGAATKQDLKAMEDRIMSAISDYATKVEEQFTVLSTAVDGVATDVADLKKIIEELNNNPGPITPADQALLDAALVKLTGLADRVKTLDESTGTPPAPPA